MSIRTILPLARILVFVLCHDFLVLLLFFYLVGLAEYLRSNYWLFSSEYGESYTSRDRPMLGLDRSIEANILVLFYLFSIFFL